MWICSYYRTALGQFIAVWTLDGKAQYASEPTDTLDDNPHEQAFRKAEGFILESVSKVGRDWARTCPPEIKEEHETV